MRAGIGSRTEERSMLKTSLIGVTLMTAGLASAQTLGGGSTAVTGGAGPDGAKNASTELEKCSAPKGTIAVVEPQSYMLSSLSRYGLQSPVSLIRLMIQQSNCFQVVERGVGMSNLMQERSLAQSGELQADQNIGKGQMVAADFVLTPALIFKENNAGGVGAAVGGLLNRLPGGAVLGSVAGGLKFKEAQTSMLVADARSSIQVAAAEGSARTTDFAIGGFGWIPGGWGSGGGYTNTNEGKVIAASLLDNWNNIVRSLRDSPSLIQAKAGVASQANAANSVEANAAKAGDIMVAKIAGAKVLKLPADGSSELMSLTKTDEVLILGEEKNGYVKVTSPNGDGWVRKVALRKP
jgi:curli biogenesis system outer membrane secretion channel CsgG